MYVEDDVIKGIDKTIAVEDFKTKNELPKDAQIYKQVYVVLASTLSNGMSTPLFWKPFSKGVADLQLDIKKLIEILTEHEIDCYAI